MKSGIDYFPLDVSLDEKWELIEAEFGLNGFAVVVKLFQRIYGQHGYYCEWTDEVALLFSKQCGLGGNAVSEIMRASVRRGIFDKDLFEKYQILTSSGIQKRYFGAVSRRKQVEVINEYLLVDPYHFLKNECIKRKNVNISPENADISKQSKVKESKVKESKVNNSVDKPPLTRFVPPSVDEVIAYCKERNNNIDPQRFIDYYTANGWKVGRNQMKDWKAAVRTWERNDYEKPNRNTSGTIPASSKPKYGDVL